MSTLAARSVCLEKGKAGNRNDNRDRHDCHFESGKRGQATNFRDAHDSATGSRGCGISKPVPALPLAATDLYVARATRELVGSCTWGWGSSPVAWRLACCVYKTSEAGLFPVCRKISTVLPSRCLVRRLLVDGTDAWQGCREPFRSDCERYSPEPDGRRPVENSRAGAFL